MSDWTIYKTAGVSSLTPIMDDIIRIGQSTFFGDFHAIIEGAEAFPPQASLQNNNYIVLDTIDNRWAELVCISHVRLKSGAASQMLSVLVPFPTLTVARQNESFLVLVLPKAAEQGISLTLLSEFERAGFSIYATEYYHSAKAEFWAEHYRQHADTPEFGNTVALFANRPLAAAQFYKHGEQLPAAISQAQTVMAKYIAEGLLHISATPDDAVRERDIWFDDYKD